MIDVLMGAAVMATVLGGVTTFLSSAIAGSRTTTERAILARRACETVRRIADEISMADASSLSTAAEPLGANFLDFRLPQVIAAAGVTWANTTRIELQADPRDVADGTDNDGDGVIDEGIVVLRRNVGLVNEQATTLATGVAPLLEGETDNDADDNNNDLEDEAGLSFETDEDGMVTLRLTLFAATRTGVLVCTAAADVVPRN